MMRSFLKFALCTSLAVLVSPSDVFAGRGGGMQRGGGGSGMQRGGEGGGMQRGGGSGGGMGHSPSFSQPHPQGNGSASGGRNSSANNAGAGGRNSSSNNSNAGAAAAGAGASNRNQSGNSNAGAAAAGAGAANRNQSGNTNAAPAAAGAAYSNRNQSPSHPNAAPAAAGAGYANRNQSGNYPNAGAAAAGAGYANRNQSGNYSNAGAAAAGAAYANNNNQYPGMGGGYWNGNYGNGSMGSYGGMGMASPAYGYGSTPYMNPYASAGLGGVGGGQAQPASVPANNAQGNPSSYDYSQPVNTAAAPADVPPTDPSNSPTAQALQAFQAGDYPNAVQLTQKALAQTPNDVNLHQFLALGLFAQGNYEQAAAPLYAVLAVGPGWDWTALIGNYTDAGAYAGQLRGLEAFVKTNPRSAKAQFVLAYHYISQGHQEAAINPLKFVVSLQPNDTLSAQLLDKLQPTNAAATVAAEPLDASKLPGVWVAQAPPNATITLRISDDTNFTWAFVAPGKPSVTITGTYSLDNGVLTLNGKDTPGGPLAGQVASPDDKHLSFKAVGAPSSDPGLQFAR